jgi:transcriptional regulator with XRE-family HTH domain
LAVLRRQAERPVATDTPPLNPDEVRHRLYVEHESTVERLVGAYVGRLNLAPRLGRFGFDELVDAGKDGLWEATAFFDDAVNDHLVTYAWFYIMGRVKERRAQLLASAPTHDDEPRRSVDAAPAFQTLSYVEEQLAAVAAHRSVALALATLDGRGLLTAPERRIAHALRDGEFDLGAGDDADLSLTEIKLAATRLLRKLRAYLRDDELFPADGLPDEALPHLRPLTLARVRSALHHVRGGARLTPRPLAAYPGFLVDLEKVAAAVGHRGALDDPPGAAEVISIFKTAARFTTKDLSVLTGLSEPSLVQLARAGQLTARHSPARMAALANALSIDPTEVLFRALPELMGLFDSVAAVGDGVYAAVVDVDHAPETLARYLSGASEPGAAHAFGPLVRAHRLAAGAASADDLDTRCADVEAGRGVRLEHVRAVGEKLGLAPLLLLFGTWPELLALFDVVDDAGRSVCEGRCDYARLIVVARRRPVRGGRAAPPPSPGLSGYLAHLLAGRPDRLVPEALRAHGLTQRFIAGALGGTPPQLVHLPALVAALELSTLETTRLIAERVLATDLASRAAELGEIVRLLATEMRTRVEQGHGTDPFLAGLFDLDDGAFLRLNRAFFTYFATKRRDEAIAAGFDAFTDGALAILKADHVPEFAALKRLYGDDEALELLHGLWRRDALTEAEAVLLQALVLRPRSLFVLVRETGLGFAATVAALRALLGRLGS